MKTIKKNVYYCEFCGKHSLSPSLKIHENHCTANPNRSCRMCENGNDTKAIIDKYEKYFYTRKMPARHLWQDDVIQVVCRKKFTLEDLKNELDPLCPNCLLNLIRCLGLNRHYFNGAFKIDYKDMLNEWWAGENERAYKEAERETYAYDGY